MRREDPTKAPKLYALTEEAQVVFPACSQIDPPRLGDGTERCMSEEIDMTSFDNNTYRWRPL